MPNNRLFAFVFVTSVLAAGRAEAQFGAPNPAPGEDFRVEFGAMFWTPTPELRLQTGALAAVGESEIDFVDEFGVKEERFTELRAVVKAGRKHKIRFSYVPVRYDAETVLQRTVTFGGRTFPLSLPARADLEWTLWRFGYEWDFVARDRGVVGLVTELKYNEVSAELSSIIGAEAAEAKAPVPQIGLTGRGYLHRYLSVTGEFTAFRLDSDEFDVKLYDFEAYGTLSLGRYVGVQGGYRSITADYFVDDDRGDLKLEGPYFGVLVRF